MSSSIIFNSISIILEIFDSGSNNNDSEKTRNYINLLFIIFRLDFFSGKFEFSNFSFVPISHLSSDLWRELLLWYKFCIQDFISVGCFLPLSFLVAFDDSCYQLFGSVLFKILHVESKEV